MTSFLGCVIGVSNFEDRFAFCICIINVQLKSDYFTKNVLRHVEVALGSLKIGKLPLLQQIKSFREVICDSILPDSSFFKEKKLLSEGIYLNKI